MPTRKRLNLFGTRHHTATRIPPDVKKALETVVDKCLPDQVLEEWSATQTALSAASELAALRGIPWRNIGTPPESQYATHSFSDALDFPDSANVSRYGPIDVQELREELMCANIRREMEEVNCAIVVLGIAHLHSMFCKLRDEFEVEAFVFAWESF